MIDKVFVASTSVAAIGYDEPSQTLEVQFVDGNVYQYYNVPDHIYNELMQSQSKGQFVNTYIKKSYPFSRVG